MKPVSREALEQRVQALEKEVAYSKQALKESEQLYRSLVENLDLGVTLIDRDHNIVMTNAAQGRYFEKPVHEMVGNKCFQEFEKRDSVCPHCPGVRAMATGQPAEAYAGTAKEDANRNNVNIKAFPVFDHSGKPQKFIEVAWDITRGERDKEAFHQSEEQYRTILESIVDGYYEVDLAGNFTFLNDSHVKALAYSKEELMGMNNRDYMVKKDVKRVYQAYNRVFTTGEPNKGFEYEAIRKDGTRRYIESSASLIKDAKGQPIGFMGIMRDITERKKTEAEREKLITELQDALSKVKTLRGLVPICSGCKKIRNDEGYWQQVEEYVKAHTDADFSHGICDECAEKLYPELFVDDEEDDEKKKSRCANTRIERNSTIGRSFIEIP